MLRELLRRMDMMVLLEKRGFPVGME